MEDVRQQYVDARGAHELVIELRKAEIPAVGITLEAPRDRDVDVVLEHRNVGVPWKPQLGIVESSAVPRPVGRATPGIPADDHVALGLV